MDSSREQRAFTALNLAVVPVWLAMILAPRSELTERIVRWSDALLVGLSATYVAQLVTALDNGMDFTRAESWREGMSRPEGFLTGWTHFIVFDLVVGRWIWETARQEGRSARLALLLTFFAGPSGLAVFAVQRRSLRP